MGNNLGLGPRGLGVEAVGEFVKELVVDVLELQVIALDEAAVKGENELFDLLGESSGRRIEVLDQGALIFYGLAW